MFSHPIDSRVDFDVRSWTLPDIHTVRYTRDAVLSAARAPSKGPA